MTPLTNSIPTKGDTAMDTTVPSVSPDTQAFAQDRSAGPRETASRIRRSARDVLGGHSGGMSHRLLLTLAVITVLTVSFALYAATACLSMAGYLAFADAPWVSATATTLLAALMLALALPLAVSVCRLACLMAAPDGEVSRGMAVSVPTPSLTELFYPFTSLRAYGRTMAVGMESLAFLVLGLGIPLLAGRMVWLWVLTDVRAVWLRALVIVGLILLGLGWAFGILLLSGRRMGFAYFVFVHEELSLGDANRCYCSHRRPLLSALCLRLWLLGLYGLSFAAICVPFVWHFIPLGFCCAAVYGRDLTPKNP